MMRRQLDDVRSWGEPLAVLTASEPAIYGRFGYGVGTYHVNAEIDTTRVRLSVPPGTDDVRLRYAEPADVLDACEAVYAQLVARRPGMVARIPGWERLWLLDPESERDGASALQCVVAEREGEITGYARFRTKLGWGVAGHGQPEGERARASHARITVPGADGTVRLGELTPQRPLLGRLRNPAEGADQVVVPLVPVFPAQHAQVSHVSPHEPCLPGHCGTSEGISPWRTRNGFL